VAASGSSRGGRKSAVPARPTIPPRELRPAPVVLVTGGEGLLADRAVAAVIAAARATDAETEVERLDAATYEAGRLTVATSPSLFGGGKVVVVDAVDKANDALVVDATAYVRSPDPDACVVLRHNGGQRAKALIDAARKADAPESACVPLTRDDEKADFVAEEFRQARRRIAPAALRALVDAVGSDLRELAAACAQLVDDTGGPGDAASGDHGERIEVDTVERYFGGRIEVTGFRVADAAVAGQTDQALGLLRHALATGADPVPLVAAVAAKVRALAKVSAAGRGKSVDLARELGLAPWQVDRARRELSGWNEEGLAAAVLALAEADTMVKGGGRDPVYAVERLVMQVSRRRA
jgi:DNA polymerase-3 subunit delta